MPLRLREQRHSCSKQQREDHQNPNSCKHAFRGLDSRETVHRQYRSYQQQEKRNSNAEIDQRRHPRRSKVVIPLIRGFTPLIIGPEEPLRVVSKAWRPEII